MTVRKKGQYWYGDSHDDIVREIRRYSASEYPAEQFASAKCLCGHEVFRLAVDDSEGVAIRTCERCRKKHPIGDSAEYLADAEPETCACPCGEERFEITVGVALYNDGLAVRWLYLGCRCPNCNLVAVYGDWKNEFEDYRELLANI